MTNWQKCPICNGSGIEIDSLTPNGVKCSVCKGRKIINVLDGKPPKDIANNTEQKSQDFNNYKERDFRDTPRESQQSYFGK